MSTFELGGHSAIGTSHRARTAYIYVRQSSVNQVIHNSESTDLQYGLSSVPSGSVGRVIGWWLSMMTLVNLEARATNGTAFSA